MIFSSEYQYWNVSVLDEGSVCGGVVSDEIGFIGALDSDGDLLYDLNTDCLWLIQPSDGYKVRYKLESYNLEMSDNCFKDFLQVSLNTLKSSIFEAMSNTRNVLCDK